MFTDQDFRKGQTMKSAVLFVTVFAMIASSAFAEGTSLGHGEGGRIVVVTGLGGMGKAIAKRLGSGSTVVLADFNPATLKAAADQMRADGYRVIEHSTDVSDETSVAALVDTASGLGRVEVLIHTAGLSPVQASAEAILRVDLLGSALILDGFASAIADGGSGEPAGAERTAGHAVRPEYHRRRNSVRTQEAVQ